MHTSLIWAHLHQHLECSMFKTWLSLIGLCMFLLGHTQISQAQKDSSIPVMDMYILTEAGHMVTNQASVNSIIDVAWTAPFCYHLFPSDIDKQFWRAVGLHAFSAIVIAEQLRDLEVAFNAPPSTFLPNDAHHWWNGATKHSRSIIIEQGKEWADRFTFDTCMYLINNYTTYGKIPVPDGPLIYPR